MGAGSTKLKAQEPPLKPLYAAAIGQDAPLQLDLAPKTPDNALTISYNKAEGELAIVQLRNHYPHNAVTPEEARGGLPFNEAVVGPATVHYLDPRASSGVTALCG